MKRRDFIAATGALAANGLKPLEALAQKRHRIFMVTWRGRTMVEQGFEDYLGSRGIPFELIQRDAQQSPAKVAEFAREAMETKPDLIFTWGTPPTLGMAGPHDKVIPGVHVSGIPILFALVAAPVGARIVTSLNKQGRDITGVFHVAPLEAQLKAMQAYRRFKVGGALFNSAEANAVSSVKELTDISAKQGIRWVTETFERDEAGKPRPDNVEAKIAALKRAGAEWLYLGPDSYLFTQIERVAAAANVQRLPTFSAVEGPMNAKAGVLAGLVSKYEGIGQFAGYKAEQILMKGVRARDIPIETLTRYAYVVRMDVARQLDFLPPLALFNYAEFRS